MNRRSFLVGTAGTLSFLAGCVGDSSSEPAEPSGSATSRETTTLSPRTTRHTTTTTPTDTTETISIDTTETTPANATEATATNATETPSTGTTESTPADTPNTTIEDTTGSAPSGTTGGSSTRTTEPCSGGVTIETEVFDATEHATISLDDDARAIVAEAVANETATVAMYGEQPLQGGVFIEYDGAFYEVGHAVETSEVSAYRMNVEWERGQNAPAEATVVAFSDLPESDRNALRHAICGGEEGLIGDATDEERRLPQRSLGVHDFPAPYPEGGDTSRLIGSGVTWVSWDDHAFRVELGDATTTERDAHEYTATKVADTATEFRDAIASRFLVRLTDLPRDERKIVKRATRERYRTCGTIPETVPELEDRLTAEKQLPGGYDSWYVRFESEEYLLRILLWAS